MVGFLKVFGYEAPASPIGWNISTTVQQLITSLMVVGGILGSLAQGPLSSYLGRRRGIQIASIICMVASAIMIATTSVGALYVGRIILGVANGIFITTAQMYIVEVLPANLRGVGLGIPCKGSTNFRCVCYVNCHRCHTLKCHHSIYKDLHQSTLLPDPSHHSHGNAGNHVRHGSILP